MPLDSEALAAMYGQMTEKSLLEAIRRAAGYAGWIVYHTHDSRRSEKGFLDLVLAKTGRVMFRELKTQKGKVTLEQEMWIKTLQSAGMDAGIWRPYDWALGKVEEELNR